MGKKNSEKQLEQERRRLAEADIPDGDKKLINDLADRELGQKQTNTVRNHMLYLRKLSERMEVALCEAELDDVLGCLRDMRDGVHPDVKDDGIVVGSGYQASARVFYKTFNLGIDHRDIEVEEDYNGRELSPDDLLYVDEVDALLAAARRKSLCYSAFIALILATGQRLDAVRTLRLKHVNQDGPAMTVRLNEEEGDLKGAKGDKPLLWAKHYVRRWYESHPHKDNPDAALFPAQATGNYSSDNGWATEPPEGKTIRAMIRKIKEQAGIDKYVVPHILRHCALTRMVAEGLSEQQIKNIAGWHGDSSQFERYVTLSDEIATDSVRKELGYPTSESGAPIVGRPSLDQCPNCGDHLPDGTERCLTCKTALTHREAEKGEPETVGPGELAENMAAELTDVDLDPEQAAEVGQAVSKALGKTFGDEVNHG